MLEDDSFESSFWLENWELSQLFNMETVKNSEAQNKRNTIIRSKIIKIPYIEFNETGQVEMREDCMISSYEISADDAPERLTKLPIVKSCISNDTTRNYPVMPSLRLDMEFRNYAEPLRDRNKDWVFDSQREILNPKEPEMRIEMGHYLPDEPEVARWKSQCHDLLRNSLLLRKTVMISESYCIVQIFGLGISGRVASNAGKTKRSLIISAYSVWNSTTYTLPLTIPQLKKIFSSREHLLLPGFKMQLLNELLQLLYFDYRITIPPLPYEIEKGPTVISFSHLDSVVFPESYPQALIDIIKMVSDIRENEHEIPIPEVEQFLRISELIRENGAMKRKRELEERLRREREEEERKKREWFAVPKRLRGMVFAMCIRQHGKLAVITSYRFLRRPTACSIRTHLYSECILLLLNLVLSNIGPLFKASTNPRKWATETLNYVFQSIVKNIKLSGSHYPEMVFMLQMKDKKGPTKELSKLPTISGWQERKPKVKRERLIRLDTCTVDAMDWERKESAMGAHSMRKEFNYRTHCRPRREVGYGTRICSKVVKISSVRTVISLYYNYVKKRKIRKGIRGGVDGAIINDPTLESGNTTDNGSQNSSNNIPNNFNDKNNSLNSFAKEEKIDEINTLALGLEITLTVYVPYSRNVLSYPIPPNATYRIKFKRMDIIRMITNKEWIKLAFKSTLPSFYNHASKEEVQEGEQAWYDIFTDILKQTRWTLSSSSSSSSSSLWDQMQNSLPPLESPDSLSKKSYSEKLEYADSLLYADASLYNVKTDNNIVLYSSTLHKPLPDDDDADNTISDSDSMGSISNSISDNNRINSDHNGNDIVNNTSLNISLMNAINDPHSSTAIYPILRWSCIIFRKIIKVQSEVEERPKPTLLVVVWQKDQKFGVIAFDKEQQQEDIYFADPSQQTQKLFLTGFESFDRMEVTINLMLLLTELMFYQDVDENDIAVNKLRFVDTNNLDLDVVEKDYKEKTAVATDKAAKAARDRTKVKAITTNTNGDDNEGEVVMKEIKFYSSKAANEDDTLPDIYGMDEAEDYLDYS